MTLPEAGKSGCRGHCNLEAEFLLLWKKLGLCYQDLHLIATLAQRKRKSPCA
jgi:hypothetical protein